MREPGSAPTGSELPVETPSEVAETRSGGFRIEVSDEGDTLQLCLIGELDWGCIGHIESALGNISAERTKHVVLDLQRLTFLDMAGLRTILRANDRSLDEPFELVVVRPHGLTNRVFTLTGAGAELTMVDHTPHR